MIAIVALAACGGGSVSSRSSGSSRPPSDSTSSSGVSASPLSCPPASAVGSALGATLGGPIVGGPPDGAAGVGCEYLAGHAVVAILLVAGRPSGWFTSEERAQKQTEDQEGLDIHFSGVSGLGTEAASYSYTGDGLTASGVMAEQGSRLVVVFISGLMASVSQIEDLVRELL